MDVNEAWKKTCKILLGDEIGELHKFENYLKKYSEFVSKKESAISGKELFVGEPRFCSKAKFILFDEAELYNLSPNPLDINQIKDIDSIVRAINENICYGASTVLGNSAFVERSSDIFDSMHVSDCWLVRNSSKYMAYCINMRNSQCCFGCIDGGMCSYSIKCYNPYMNERCLEAHRSKPISDCYYVANLQGCHDCMFSFNLRNVNRAVGNLALSKEEYAKIKEKLLEDMRSTLEAKKELPTIIDIIKNAHRETKGTAVAMNPIVKQPAKAQPSVSSYESIFQNISKVVLGKTIGKLGNFEEYFSDYAVKVEGRRSALSDRIVFVPQVPYYSSIADCFAKMDEAEMHGKKSIDEQEVKGLRLDNARSRLSKIAVSSPEVEYGNNLNTLDCCDFQDSSNAYKSSYVFMSKYTLFSFFTRDCENLCGCGRLLFCRFCIRCRNSMNLNRCFEVSDSNACTDAYFCQNCENVRDSMFCFNAKNLSYAIGNVQLPKEQYARIKKLVLEEIVQKLERDKKLDLSIYNVGCN